MENSQPTKTENGPASPVDISGASTGSKPVAVTEKNESLSLSENMTATTQIDSPRIWTNAALEELRSKAGLVAGALADFQSAGGIVAVKTIETALPSGSTFMATKIYLVADGLSISIRKTPDGLEFEILPLGTNLVAVPSGSLVAVPGPARGSYGSAT